MDLMMKIILSNAYLLEEIYNIPYFKIYELGNMPNLRLISIKVDRFVKDVQNISQVLGGPIIFVIFKSKIIKE
jgi:hypothetical protein